MKVFQKIGLSLILVMNGMFLMSSAGIPDTLEDIKPYQHYIYDYINNSELSDNEKMAVAASMPAVSSFDEAEKIISIVERFEKLRQMNETPSWTTSTQKLIRKKLIEPIELIQKERMSHIEENE